MRFVEVAEFEVFFLVDIPGADRRYIWHSLSREHRKKLKGQGARILRVTVLIPNDYRDGYVVAGAQQCD